MQLKIHSESPSIATSMGNKRGKRKTSESVSTPIVEQKSPKTPKSSKKKISDDIKNGGTPKINGKLHNGDEEVFTPRRSRRKMSEMSDTSVDLKQKLQKSPKNSSLESPKSRLRKISENSFTREKTISESSVPDMSDKSTERPTGTKRKTSESGKTEQMSVADRIKLLSHDQDQKSTPPRTDSVLQLLLQGLNSKDKRILESVLERADDELIQDTVKRLPLEAVTPLLEVLHHYIQVRIDLRLPDTFSSRYLELQFRII